MEISYPELNSRPHDAYRKEGYRQLLAGNLPKPIDYWLAKVGMTLEEAGRYNFGDDPDYLNCFRNWADACWIWDAKSGTVCSFNFTTWLWVPGDKTLTNDPDGAMLGSVQHREDPAVEKARKRKERLLKMLGDRPGVFPAARSQVLGMTAIATLDEGIIAGDILFSHHAQDDFISKMTISWMTHAGIAVGPEWAVDADGRQAGEAVAAIKLKEFFEQGQPPDYDDYHDSPSGGLAVRYIGAPGDSEEAAEAIRKKAAIWAIQQIDNQWKFSIENSDIIAAEKEKGKITKIHHHKTRSNKVKIVEKRFDSKGNAVDARGKTLQYYSRSEGKFMPTPFNTIYCAELVWRAYRAAGVNLVDPRKLCNIYDDTDRAVAGALWFKILPERGEEEFCVDDEGNPKSDTHATIRRIFSGKKGAVIKRLPKSLLRKKIVAHMKTKNTGFVCAPYQLAESPLVERVAQVSPVKPEFEELTFPDFKGANLHPLEVLDALAEPKPKKPAVDDSEMETRYEAFEQAWEAFADKRGKLEKVSLYRLTSESTKEKGVEEFEPYHIDYNAPVKFPAANDKPAFHDA
ncbi:MAG: hypothetical protein EA425_00095 [Puniceicoccaceae bacterium]|nr:MAG: hypothetical protein EA425_00095 [Puniceicoccaceae bacterium]